MKTNEFISTLRARPDHQLIFVDPDGRTVRSGYHLTELKAALFETVDCGDKPTVGRKRSSNFGCHRTLLTNT